MDDLIRIPCIHCQTRAAIAITAKLRCPIESRSLEMRKVHVSNDLHATMQVKRIRAGVVQGNPTLSPLVDIRSCRLFDLGPLQGYWSGTEHSIKTLMHV